MLFDLRARGRRRTIQVIYLFLAILMGGGLIFFGIGGNTSGGLFDAFKSGGGGGGSDALSKQISQAQKTLKLNPNDAAAYAVMARDNHQFAGFNKIRLDAQGEPVADDLHLAWAAGARAIRLTPRP